MRAAALSATERAVLARCVSAAVDLARSRGVQNAGRRLAELADVDPREVAVIVRAGRTGDEPPSWRPGADRAQRLLKAAVALGDVPAGRRARPRGESVVAEVETLVARHSVRGLARRLGAHPASVRGWLRGAAVGRLDVLQRLRAAR